MRRTSHPARLRVGQFLALVLAVLAGQSAFGVTSAGAHHPEVTAAVTCEGRVTYTSTAWNGSTPASRTNPSIGVWYSTSGSGGPFTQLPNEPQHQFNAANGFSFTDSFDLPAGATSVVVKVQALSNWANGSGPGGSQQTSVLNKGDCPPQPGAEIAFVCAEGGAVVTLTNTGGGNATFDVELDGAKVATETVPAGGTKTVKIPLQEDTTHTVTVLSGGQQVATHTQLFNCEEPPEPGAEIAFVCAEGGAVVTLTNTGGIDATFDVELDGAKVATESVTAGGTKTVKIPLQEDTTHTVTVLSGGQQVATHTQLFNCEEPPPEPGAAVAFECASNGALVSLSNTGGIATVFTITLNGNVFSTETLQPGGNRSLTVPLSEDQTYTVAASAEGRVVASRTDVFNCDIPPPPPTTTLPPPPEPNPDAEVVFDCVAGGALVTLINTGDAPADFEVSLNGEVVETRTVAADDEVELTVPVVEDAEATVSVSSDGTELVTQGLTFDCTEVLGSVDQPPAAPAPAPAALPQVAVQPQELPRTGNSSSRLLQLALMLIGIGGALVLGSRASAAERALLPVAARGPRRPEWWEKAGRNGPIA